MCKKERDGQLELFTKVNSALDDLDNGINRDDKPLDPRDDPFSPNYKSKVLCDIDDKHHSKKRS